MVGSRTFDDFGCKQFYSHEHMHSSLIGQPLHILAFCGLRRFREIHGVMNISWPDELRGQEHSYL